MVVRFFVVELLYALCMYVGTVRHVQFKTNGTGGGSKYCSVNSNS